VELPRRPRACPRRTPSVVTEFGLAREPFCPLNGVHTLGFLAASLKTPRAHKRHRSAIPFHVDLLAGSRVNRAIGSQSAACFKNSLRGFIGGP
jgi:hypothetical protein